MSILRAMGLLLAALQLGGCDTVASVAEYAKRDYDRAKERVDIMRGAKAAPQPIPPAHAPVYCYRTIAMVDCYATPVAGEETRLKGVGSAYAEGLGSELIFAPVPAGRQAEMALYEPVTVRNAPFITPPPPPPPPPAASPEAPGVLIEGRRYDADNLPSTEDISRKSEQKLLEEERRLAEQEEAEMWK